MDEEEVNELIFEITLAKEIATKNEK